MSGKRNLAIWLFALVTIGAIISGGFAGSVSRIRGGHDAVPGTFTFIVSLGYSAYPYSHGCGGAIISSRHILTAGHCVYNRDVSDITVRSGLQNLYDDNAISSVVNRVFLHPQYIPYIQDIQNMENDIAIIELETDLDLDGEVNQIALPDGPPPYGPYYHIAGWGDNDTLGINREPAILQSVSGIELLDELDCYYKGGGTLTPSTLCAFKDDATICAGDSGSPLVSNGRIYGVASASYCRVEDSHVYTNVYYFMDWIESAIYESVN